MNKEGHRREAEWRKQYDLKRTRTRWPFEDVAYGDGHRTAGCGDLLDSPFDHRFVYKYIGCRVRGAHLLVCHPYAYGPEYPTGGTDKNLVATRYAAAKGLILTVIGDAGSYYFPGNSTMVVWQRPEVIEAGFDRIGGWQASEEETLADAFFS